MNQTTIIEHPILKHKLSHLRDKNTNSLHFRLLIKEVSSLIAYEALRDLPTKKSSVQTQLAEASTEVIENAPIIVSIMRAGNGMLDSVFDLIPFASAGHIGIYRDKFINNTVEYYFQVPKDSKGKTVLLLDPLMATGDTVIASVDRLKQYEVGEIKLLTVLCSKESLKKLHSLHPDVKVYTLAVEDKLNDSGYLVPGIGDAGDRLFQSK